MDDQKPEIDFSLRGDEVALRISAPVRTAAEVYKRANRQAGPELMDGTGVREPSVHQLDDSRDVVHVDTQSISGAIAFLKELSDLEALPTDSAIRRLEAYED